MLQNNPKLKSLIDELWNKFWAGGISNLLTAIEQITYLLFMKRLDDLDTTNLKNAEFAGDSYSSKFEGTFTPPNTNISVDKSKLRWCEFRRMPAEEMLTHVQVNVFPYLKELNGGTSPFTQSLSSKKLAEIVKKTEALKEKYLRSSQELDNLFNSLTQKAFNGAE